MSFANAEAEQCSGSASSVSFFPELNQPVLETPLLPICSFTRRFVTEVLDPCLSSQDKSYQLIQSARIKVLSTKWPSTSPYFHWYVAFIKKSTGALYIGTCDYVRRIAFANSRTVRDYGPCTWCSREHYSLDSTIFVNSTLCTKGTFPSNYQCKMTTYIPIKL